MRPQLNPLILGPGAPWSLPGSSLDIQFTTGRAAVNRQTSSISSLLTTTRASTGYATTSTGSLVLFPTNTPRITDLGLLVEQAATNLALQSNTFNTTWATINGASVTANSATDPTNANNGWLLASASNFGAVQQSITIVSGTTYTASAFCKAGTTHVVGVQFRDGTSTNIVGVKADLNAGTVTGTEVVGNGVLVASGIIPFGNGWYRVWVAGTITSTSGGIAIADRSNAPINIDIFGAQLEASAFPTSYIPTTTVAVTRAADVISLAGAAQTAALASQSVRLDASGAPNAAGFPALFYFNGNSQIFVAPVNVGSTTVACRDTSNNSTNATVGSGATTGRTIVSVSYKSGSSRNIANNGTAATSAFPMSPSAPVYVGTSAGNNQYNGYIRRLSLSTAFSAFDSGPWQ